MNDNGAKRMPGPIQDVDSDELKAEHVKILDRLSKDRRRVRRLRVLAAVLWGMVLIGGIPFGPMSLRLKELSPLYVAIMGFYVIAFVLLLIVAAVCTASLYIRSRSINQREILAALASIEKALHELGSKHK